MSEKKRLLVGVSGGRTSAYMAGLIKLYLADQYDLVFVFTNTGQENEETLRFVKQVDEYFNLGVVWVEADINPKKGKGVRHRVVDFNTACRDGSLFEQMIMKHGLPGPTAPICTRELKSRPLHSYITRHVGWKKGTYETAVGIRTDEDRRAKPNSEYNPVYPLIDRWPTDKQDVNSFWEDQPFNLELLDHQGNCKWCWKKSFRKHYRIIKDNPHFYDLPRMLEAKYSRVGSEFEKDPDEPDRRFFRGRKTVDQLFSEADLIPLANLQFFDDEDQNSGCTESCEFISFM